MTKAPYEAGDRIDKIDLISWDYTGVWGKPGVDKRAVRRFTKGTWVLEVLDYNRPDSPIWVVSIRSSDADERFWNETRDRLMRHKGRR